jgi:hypothetical protein
MLMWFQAPQLSRQVTYFRVQDKTCIRDKSKPCPKQKRGDNSLLLFLELVSHPFLSANEPLIYEIVLPDQASIESHTVNQDKEIT